MAKNAAKQNEPNHVELPAMRFQRYSQNGYVAGQIFSYSGKGYHLKAPINQAPCDLWCRGAQRNQ
jgi:hypothetical protein